MSKSIYLSELLTAARPARGSGFRGGLGRRGVSLYGLPEYLLQLLGIRGRDGETSDGHLHQRQPHAPDIRLHGVVGALQSLRLGNGGWGVEEWRGGVGRRKWEGRTGRQDDAMGAPT